VGEEYFKGFLSAKNKVVPLRLFLVPSETTVAMDLWRRKPLAPCFNYNIMVQIDYIIT
jgi:hypothetical protein